MNRATRDISNVYIQLSKMHIPVDKYVDIHLKVKIRGNIYKDFDFESTYFHLKDMLK